MTAPAACTWLLTGLFLSPVPGAQEPPLRVAIRAGPKTHGEGEHDHPRFLSEWSELLRSRGCTVQGALEFPDEDVLAESDVLILYAADGASIHDQERARLERFLGRGGGLVVLHDAVCGDDPLWFQTVAGGAWEHGRSQYLEGEIGLLFADREHPITRGAANFDFEDEIYWSLHLDPSAHVLANAFHTPFDVTPQMWVLERQAYRAFVSIQGHNARSFAHPAWRTLLLRGIAWAGRRPADELVTPEELAGLRYPPGGPLAPDQAAQGLALHPDFELALVAAEPLVVNPISLDWDARGRPWVALTPGYPDKQEFAGLPARDAIAILSDQDGDGRMDGSALFAEGLDLVTSLVFHGDGVIVAQAPEILWLRDRDGDDRADGRETLFRGFGYGDTHAVISNLRWGLDGWIYGTQGYSGNASKHVLGRDGKDHGAIGNGVFRFRPDGSAIEQVASYGSNTWGLDFTWDNELFFTMANGSHLRHVVLPDRAFAAGRIGKVESWFDVTDHDRVFPLRSHERPPYQQIDFVGGFTGASGSCLYTGGAWPAEYEGDHFVCEPTVNLVHHDSLEPRSVTFAASKARQAEFLAATDLWFRPVHLRVGPDGALYVLDFYNQAAVHNDTRGPAHGPTNAAVRPDRDHEHGRIWRIQHRAARALAQVPLAGADEAELVSALEHDNAWQRATARRLLCERELTPAGSSALADRALNAYRPWTQIEALWILARKDRHRLERVLESALRDPDGTVQRNGLAILGTLGSWERARFAARASELLWSSDARTALLALGALREDVGPAELARLLAEFPALEDDWRRSAVLALGARDPAGFVRACLQSPAATGLAPLTETIGRELARRADLKQAVEIVLVLAEHAQRAPALAEGLLRSCSALTEKPWPSPRLDAALTRLVAGDSLSVAIAALPLAERWGQSSKLHEALAALATRLGALVSAPDQPLELRLRALESMLALPGQRSVGIELAPAFLDPIHPLDCQLRVIEALGGLTDARASSALCASFEQLSQPARERVFARLVEREESTAILLDALESAEILFTELGPQRLHRLRQHPVPALAARANQLFDRLGGAERSDKDALLSELVPLVEGPGDRGRGRTVFEQNCANCHTVKGVETRGGVGPDLTGMGARGARELLPFLIDPNRAVDPAYLEYALTTTDGRLVDGVIVREDERSLLLRNSSGETEVARTEIASLRSTGRSPMPTGFESLGPEALRDLVAFLAGDYSGFRLLDLRPLANASATRGLYDQTRDAKPMRFARYGVVEALGVPFEVLDPARMDGEKNALVLRGGLAEGWESKGYAQRAEIPLGFALRRLHVLGGIAAWGFPYTKTRAPIVKLTWRYADGTSEEQVLADGAEFADWIGRHEVPGSTWVDLLDGESWGQVRVFALTPGRPGELLEALVLESFDNHLAPTFLALTAELEDRTVSERTTPAPRPEPGILIFGGGSSHDFERWFAREDSATLAPLGRALSYSEDPAELATALSGLDVLVLCNNQPLVDPTLRRALFDFVLSGGGLALVHPATWYNWPDWPEYNRELVGGGAKSHEDFAEFRVTLTGREHPLLAGVPAEFTITDELYRFEPDASVPSHVLALGRSLSSGEEYPVLWTRGFGDGRIVGLTLGHDGAAHEHPAYRRLLANAVGWLAEGP